MIERGIKTMEPRTSSTTVSTPEPPRLPTASEDLAQIRILTRVQVRGQGTEREFEHWSRDGVASIWQRQQKQTPAPVISDP